MKIFDPDAVIFNVLVLKVLDVCLEVVMICLEKLSTRARDPETTIILHLF
jgi:hypothetical protein